MQTIVITSTDTMWEAAKRSGWYSQSTINASLSDVGFIHATKPSQTIAMINRHFQDRDDVILLLIDIETIQPEVKFEKSLSGRDELFPHIYGALNTDAVYDAVKPKKDSSGAFVESAELIKAD